MEAGSQMPLYAGFQRMMVRVCTLLTSVLLHLTTYVQDCHLDNVILCCHLCLHTPSSWGDQLLARQLVHCPVPTVMPQTHQHASED